MSNFRKTLENLWWGADLHILNQCVDEKIKFIRDEVLIWVISILNGVAFDSMGASGFLGWLIAFVIYKWFLSNLYLTLHKSWGFLKLIISTTIAVSITYGISELFGWNILNSLIADDMAYIDDISGIIVTGIVFIVSIVLCYSPVRFLAPDSLYAKLSDLDKKQDELCAETIIKEESLIKTNQTRAKIEILKAAEKEYSSELAHQIAQSRLRVAMAALRQWEVEQIKEIDSNTNVYINGNE